jgi:hypothetical protein
VQLVVNAKGSFTADSQQAARGALGGSSVSDAQLRAALLAAAEAELAGKPSTAADDERMLQVGGGWGALPATSLAWQCLVDLSPACDNASPS